MYFFPKVSSCANDFSFASCALLSFEFLLTILTSESPYIGFEWRANKSSANRESQPCDLPRRLRPLEIETEPTEVFQEEQRKRPGRPKGPRPPQRRTHSKHLGRVGVAVVTARPYGGGLIRFLMSHCGFRSGLIESRLARGSDAI